MWVQIGLALILTIILLLEHFELGKKKKFISLIILLLGLFTIWASTYTGITDANESKNTVDSLTENLNHIQDTLDASRDSINHLGDAFIEQKIINDSLKKLGSIALEKATSHEYQKPTSKLISRFKFNLKALKSKYKKYPQIVLKVNPDPIIDKVASDLDIILRQEKLGYYFRGHFDWMIAKSGFYISCSQNNLQYLSDFKKSIKVYIEGEFLINESGKELGITKDDEYIMIYLNGTPTFDVNGKVTIN